MQHPYIIQGGMGAGVSNWRLARTVAEQGGLGVVSSVALDVILVRRLQQGDPGGHMRRALKAFPDQAVASGIIEKYYNEEATEDFHDFKQPPVFTLEPAREIQEITVAANFAEVYLAKEGHSGKVGINYLEKIQMPNPASVYGAMLAGVDYVLVGAGIPLEFPQMIEKFTQSTVGRIKLNVEGAQRGHEYIMELNPAEVLQDPPKELKRPYFFPIVSSFILAMTMAKKVKGVDGLILENHTAGGHNAPPRGALQLDAAGSPVFGSKDEMDYKRIAELGLPFWLAGGYSMPASLESAREEGAEGIQVGSVFAFCRESGLSSELRHQFLKSIETGEQEVFTDPKASPTGFPFKVAHVEGTLSEQSVYEQRKRVCNLGYLRQIYRKADGSVGYRCPAEPVDQFTRKGGAAEQTEGRKCLCNALLSNIGLAKRYPRGYTEQPLVTVGEHTESIELMIKEKGHDYSAADVLEMLRS
ncbi:MAG: nitronate monooxygenase [Spirochaetia bacterium]